MVANIFGKIYALTGKLAAQNRVSSITRQIARLTKDIGRAEKQFNSEKRAAINQAKMMSNSVFGMANIMASGSVPAEYASLFTDVKKGQLDMSKAGTDEFKTLYAQFQQWQSGMQQFGQNQLNQTLAMIEDQYDAQYEMTIQAMKDEQVDLEAEKATAEAQVQIYEGMEKQEGEFAKKNIQNTFEA